MLLTHLGAREGRKSKTTAPGGANTSLQYNNGGVFGGTNATYNSATGTITFVPTVSGAGLNVGSVTSDVGINAGDMWLRSDQNSLKIQVIATPRFIPHITSPVLSQIPFFNATNASGMGGSVNLTFTGSNVFTTGRGVFQNANNGGAINLTPAAGAPSSPSNGDLWYNTTSPGVYAHAISFGLNNFAIGGGNGVNGLQYKTSAGIINYFETTNSTAFNNTFSLNICTASSFSSIPNNTAFEVECIFNAIQTSATAGARGMSVKIIGAFRKDNTGTYVQIGASATQLSVIDAADTIIGSTLTISAGGNISLNLTFGAIANTYNGVAFTRVFLSQ